jgi:hypothetical protein
LLLHISIRKNLPLLFSYKKDEIQTFSIVYKSTIKNNQLNNTVTQNIETNKTNIIPSSMKCAVGKYGAGMK